ncbi:hypothetical protein ADUPG1_013984 [Aduncisulcus paluster]|uniref:Uncharacterized protein n=1 Tax=Aduncisulcus paluster TaxID=2918883 RepID=A0ABQ5K5M4_9EUKA|nr:hypothetical protein ADUPG1_013984 [Aduncisulcus paluster]
MKPTALFLRKAKPFPHKKRIIEKSIATPMSNRFDGSHEVLPRLTGVIGANTPTTITHRLDFAFLPDEHKSEDRLFTSQRKELREGVITRDGIVVNSYSACSPDHRQPITDDHSDSPVVQSKSQSDHGIYQQSHDKYGNIMTTISTSRPVVSSPIISSLQTPSSTAPISLGQDITNRSHLRRFSHSSAIGNSLILSPESPSQRPFLPPRSHSSLASMGGHSKRKDKDIIPGSSKYGLPLLHPEQTPPPKPSSQKADQSGADISASVLIPRSVSSSGYYSDVINQSTPYTGECRSSSSFIHTLQGKRYRVQSSLAPFQGRSSIRSNPRRRSRSSVKFSPAICSASSPISGIREEGSVGGSITPIASHPRYPWKNKSSFSNSRSLFLHYDNQESWREVLLEVREMRSRLTDVRSAEHSTDQPIRWVSVTNELEKEWEKRKKGRGEGRIGGSVDGIGVQVWMAEEDKKEGEVGYDPKIAQAKRRQAEEKKRFEIQEDLRKEQERLIARRKRDQRTKDSLKRERNRIVSESIELGVCGEKFTKLSASQLK